MLSVVVIVIDGQETKKLCGLAAQVNFFLLARERILFFLSRKRLLLWRARQFVIIELEPTVNTMCFLLEESSYLFEKFFVHIYIEISHTKIFFIKTNTRLAVCQMAVVDCQMIFVFLGSQQISF